MVEEVELSADHRRSTAANKGLAPEKLGFVIIVLFFWVQVSYAMVNFTAVPSREIGRAHV